MIHIMKFKGCFINNLLLLLLANICRSEIPLVITTWNFVNATMAAWNILDAGGSAIDAVVTGCNVCQIQQCDRTVGYGGSPDENGETTLDALIMDGTNMNVGAVAGLRNVKNAIAVARHVLENTRHSFLVGDQASDFAKHMGFVQESLQTEESHKVWDNWKSNDCQPNFWMNVVPDASTSCGPYSPESYNDINSIYWNDKIKFGRFNHDTIGMIVIDGSQKIIAGTSTNGAKHKIPGRVGDSPIIGSGAYADGEIGAAAATGDGDILMRFLPSYQSVENLRNGDDPNTAGEKALRRIIKYYEKFMGAVIVATKDGKYGAACYGLQEFPYSVYNTISNNVIVEHVKCFT